MSHKNLPDKPETSMSEINKSSFKGYTMEELKYQKALVALRKEFCKSNVLHSIQGLKNPVTTSNLPSKIPFLSSSSKSPVLRIAGVASKMITKTVLKNMKPLDYIMLGISLISPARKAIGLFKKKKNK